MPITSILMTDNSHRSPVHHVVQSSSQALVDSSTAEIPIPSDQQLHMSPSRPKSVWSPAKSPIPKAGSQTGKRIQVQQPPYATPSKNLKEKPTSWTTPPPNPGSVSEENRHMSSPIISTPKLLTPTADQESVTDEEGVSNIKKELSFADNLVSTRYFKDKKPSPAYDSELDRSTSSSDSGDVKFDGTNEKDLEMTREDDVEDDEMLVDQDTFLQARVVAGRARPSPTVNLRWDQILDRAVRKVAVGHVYH